VARGERSGIILTTANKAVRGEGKGKPSGGPGESKPEGPVVAARGNDYWMQKVAPGECKGCQGEEGPDHQIGAAGKKQISRRTKRFVVLLGKFPLRA